MKIAVIGSWKEHDSAEWALTGSLTAFGAACREIGRTIALRGHTLVVASHSKRTADRFAVQGFLKAKPKAAEGRIIVFEDGSQSRYAEEIQAHNGAFEARQVPPSEKGLNTLFQATEADRIITVGGAQRTYESGLLASMTRKSIWPVGAFGGASLRLSRELVVRSNEAHTDELLMPAKLRTSLQTGWRPELAARIVPARRNPRIIIIHGHSDHHKKLRALLEPMAEPLLMMEKLRSGQTLAGKWESIAARADAAIAILTPDDKITNSRKKPTRHARPNVWVEIGWVWGRFGLDRVLLVRRGETYLPSDLEGIDHAKYVKAPDECLSDIQDFVRHVAAKL
jgi:predicted nucleotide-binding protein